MLTRDDLMGLFDPGPKKRGPRTLGLAWLPLALWLRMV